MRIIGNFLWFIFGGIWMGLSWWLFGAFAYLSIIGIPWGKACFVIGQFTFFPFGKEAISRSELRLEEDIGTGVFGTTGNVIWFILAGFWLAIAHVFAACMCFLTIIGIPFGLQHLKLAGISLLPIGKTIVTKEVAAAARKANAENAVAGIRGGNINQNSTQPPNPAIATTNQASSTITEPVLSDFWKVAIAVSSILFIGNIYWTFWGSKNHQSSKPIARQTVSAEEAAVAEVKPYVAKEEPPISSQANNSPAIESVQNQVSINSESQENKNRVLPGKYSSKQQSFEKQNPRTEHQDTGFKMPEPSSR